MTGTDDIPWPSLDHAYGNARDVPAMLRAAAQPRRDRAHRGVQNLHASVLHQGSLYSATAPAVRQVAALALEPRVKVRAALAAFVGTAGASAAMLYDDEIVLATREAVTAAALVLLPLLSDPDPDVRASAAFAVGHGPAEARDPVAEAYAREEHPTARASLLLALARLDPAGAAVTAACADPEPPAVRAAAGYARAVLDLGWDPLATAAVVDAWTAADEDGPLADWPWSHRPLDDLTEILGTRAVPVALGLLASPNPAARAAGGSMAEKLCRAYRSAPPLLVPAMAAALTDDDPDVRRRAVTVVRIVGGAHRVADALYAVAARPPGPPDPEQRLVPKDPSEAALCLLATTGHPALGDLVRAALDRGRIPMELPGLLAEAGLPFSADLLARVRARLALLADTPLVPNNERAGWCDLLASWGTAASPALPEVLAVAPLAGVLAADVLVTFGGPEAVAALASVAVEANPYSRVAAARAHWRASGDPTVARAVAADLFARDQDTAGAVGLWQDLDAGPLPPAVLGLLNGVADVSFPGREAQVAVARHVYRTTGDAARVLPTVVAVIRAGERPAGLAATLAGEIGDPGVLDDLRALLDDRWAATGAAGAIHALTGDRSGLVDPLVAVVASGFGWRPALDLLVRWGAAEAVPGLAELADRDERVVTSGVLRDGACAEDDALVVAVRAAVEELSRAAPGGTG
ncbi:HEAT repeat domain-containing protein [Longispora urticae]